MATAKAVNIIPRLLTRKGDFIRGKAEDFTIFLVELPFPFDELACQKAVDEGQSRSRPKPRAGELGERVKVEIVHCLENWILRTVEIS